MADRFPSLDEFDSGQTDVKPTAAEGSSFLERERALLGDDAAEFSTPQDRNLSSTVEDDAGDYDDDLLGEGSGGGQQDLGGFEDAFPSIDGTNEFNQSSSNITQPTYSTPFQTTSSQQQHQPQEDSEAISTWRAKRDADIERRDRISADKKEATIAEARTAIDDFYETYNDKKEKNINASRKEADEFLKNRDDTTAGGTSWDRIAKLVDLGAKGTKGGSTGGAGKERFREMLLSLRKDENAPGASGL